MALSVFASALRVITDCLRLGISHRPVMSASCPRSRTRPPIAPVEGPGRNPGAVPGLLGGRARTGGQPGRNRGATALIPGEEAATTSRSCCAGRTAGASSCCAAGTALNRKRAPRSGGMTSSAGWTVTPPMPADPGGPGQQDRARLLIGQALTHALLPVSIWCRRPVFRPRRRCCARLSLKPVAVPGRTPGRCPGLGPGQSADPGGELRVRGPPSRSRPGPGCVRPAGRRGDQTAVSRAPGNRQWPG
jgi:hypothetical protein